MSGSCLKELKDVKLGKKPAAEEKYITERERQKLISVVQVNDQDAMKRAESLTVLSVRIWSIYLADLFQTRRLVFYPRI